MEEPKTEEPQKPDVVEEPSQPTVTEPEKPAEPETPAENKPADNSSSTETTVGNVKGFVAVDYANMRKQPSTDSGNSNNSYKGYIFYNYSRNRRMVQSKIYKYR